MIAERHELLERYLAELDRRLLGADPGERADIVASVREHVEVELASLGRPATAADVQRALDELGTVDAVVEAWGPETLPGFQPPASPAVSGLVVVAGVLAALAFASALLPFVGMALGAAALVLGVVGVRRSLHPRWVAVIAATLGAVALVLSTVVTGGLVVWRSEGVAVSPAVLVDEAPPTPATPSP